MIYIAAFVIVFAAGIAIGFGLHGLIVAYKKFSKRVSHLEADVEELRCGMEIMAGEIKDLKDRRLHPHPTRDGLETAVAIYMDIAQNYDECIKYTYARIQQVTEIIKIVRGDPFAFREGPNQKIPLEIRRK